MPRNMRLRVVIEWADTGKEVLVDGKPLSMDENTFLSGVQNSVKEIFVSPEDKTLKYTEEQLLKAVDDAFEHPGIEWWRLATQKRLETVGAEAAEKAVQDAIKELGKAPEDPAIKQRLLDAVSLATTEAIRKTLRLLKQETVRVVG